MARNFPVEPVLRFLGGLKKISAVYLPSPSWSAAAAIEDLARGEVDVKVFSTVEINPESRQFFRSDSQVTLSALPDGPLSFLELCKAHPQGCDLLVLEDPSRHHTLLSDALNTSLKPALIALNDLVESGAARRATYEALTGAAYYYAGLCGGFSLWTNAKRPAETLETVLTALPQAISNLPLSGKGVVNLDADIVPHGEIWNLPARSLLKISGWAMISKEAAPADQVFACVRHEETGLEEFMLLPREPRPDVSAHFGTERLLMTGFRADISALVRRIGAHEVTLVQSDGSSRYESEPLFRFALQLQDYEIASRAGLANRYLFGSGIEIGALQKPLRLSAGCQVRYIDRMTLAHLLEHYPEMAKLPLQAPDIVDDGQRLLHIAEDSQDFVIANHFLEHCQDPIRSLQTILRVLRQNGILYLAVPDKRNTFDLRRPSTSYSALKDAFVSGQREGTAELFYEWAHLVTGLTPEKAKIKAAELIAEDYSIHYNVWSTTDLLGFLLAARQDFHMPFELVAAVSSENETIVLLERTRGKLPI